MFLHQIHHFLTGLLLKTWNGIPVFLLAIGQTSVDIYFKQFWAFGESWMIWGLHGSKWFQMVPKSDDFRVGTIKFWNHLEPFGTIWNHLK